MLSELVSSVRYGELPDLLVLLSVAAALSARQVSAVSVLTTIEYYGHDLEIYGHLGLPRFHRSASFHERADGTLVMLLRHCPLVHTLVSGDGTLFSGAHLGEW